MNNDFDRTPKELDGEKEDIKTTEENEKIAFFFGHFAQIPQLKRFSFLHCLSQENV